MESASELARKIEKICDPASAGILLPASIQITTLIEDRDKEIIDKIVIRLRRLAKQYGADLKWGSGLEVAVQEVRACQIEIPGRP